MTTLLEAPIQSGLQISALRRGDTLCLRFHVNYPMHVHLALRCLEGSWRWEEDLGLVLPGDEVASVQLKDWPGEPTLLHVSVLGGPWRGPRDWRGLVPLAGAQGAYLCS